MISDEAVRVAVGIRLGLPICVRHQSHCGLQVVAQGVHSFMCKQAPSRTARHQALNELITRALASADIQGAKWPGKGRWQETWWPVSYSMAWKQTTALGHDSDGGVANS